MVNQVKSLEWQSKPVGRGAMVLAHRCAGVALGYRVHSYHGPAGSIVSRYGQSLQQFEIPDRSLVYADHRRLYRHRVAPYSGSRLDLCGRVDIPTQPAHPFRISVLTFTAVKAITAGKVEGKPDVKTSASAPKAIDLITDDNDRTDLGDFQMAAITILAVIIYAISAVEFMEQLSSAVSLRCLISTRRCFPYSA